MRDVTDQIAEYFDVAVERVTADDVFAAARIGRPTQIAPVRETRLRPAWALAVTFVTTLVVVSGSIGLGLLLRSGGSPIGAGGPAVSTDGIQRSVPWALIAIAAVSVAVIVIVVAVRRRRIAAAVRGGGLPDEREHSEGGTMTTTTPPAPVDERVHHLEVRNRTLTIVVAVLAVLAIGLGAWAVYQAVATDAGPDEVLSLTDDWFAANAARDGSVVALYAANGYHQYGTDQYRGGNIAAHLSSNPTLEHEWIGDPTVIYESDDGSRYIVSRPMRITAPAGTYESVVLFEAVRNTDGDLLLAQTEWLYDHGTGATSSR
jgi:hypothetical protein